MKKNLFLLALMLSCAMVGLRAEEKTVDCGSTVRIEATPKTGYHFVKWSDDVTDNPRTFSNVQEALTLSAIFAKEYVITITATEGGSVDTTGATLEEGQSITVTATPDECYAFVQWSDGNTDNPRTITASSALTQLNFEAQFERKTFKFSVSSEDETKGTVTLTVL